ncbi:MAG TPA: HAMP domain-containing histidine kinase [Leptolyngbyaceae cyanobacterium M33_DOE_097]|uniref:histidine kinase n=1 Tax=Oscillatoriales cyanobacterium SpSt-418 TaxID=2282169 RepID=A0A7C3KCX2_9CYAN|nr:HAMP domain-containing histidine kinase [Leptolyngbyaceae cyanobacterium M33_DOE_097]
MIVSNLLWLIIGIGLGLVGARFLQQKPLRRTFPQSGEKPLPPAPQPEAHANQTQATALAYQMATEMSQFKAGLLARTSHELRSPLNGLIGMHQLILSDLCDSPEEEREFLTQANESALNMVRLLDELIEISRLEHGTSKLKLEAISLAELLTEIQTATHMQAANRRLKLIIQPPEPDIWVQADYLRLRQVLLFLVDSAIAQLTEGGVQLSCQADPGTQQVYIWIDDPRSPDLWQEPAQLSQADAPVAKADLSEGMRLITSQILLHLMGGDLQPTVLPTTQRPTFQQRLQCTLPLASEVQPLTLGQPQL